MMQPISALLTTKPSKARACAAGSPCGSMKKTRNDSTVPEITAVSYPNNRPPNVATIVNAKTYSLLFFIIKGFFII